MAKEKDPAFLFYPKDWLQGTSMLMPEEKGVFIDLLAHQHQDGAIPSDTKRLARMAGLSHDEFLPIWATLKAKFRQANFGYLVNQKLTNVVNKRIAKSRLKTITGTLASVVRLSRATPEQKEQIKKMFNINQFLETTDEFLNQDITGWFNSRLKDIENANGNETVDVLREESVREGGWIGKPGAESLDLELDPVKGGAVIELFKFTKNHDLTKPELIGLWGIFKKQNFTGQKFYQSKNDVFSHFINWSKTQNINGKNNGIKGQNTRTVGKDIEFDPI